MEIRLRNDGTHAVFLLWRWSARLRTEPTPGAVLVKFEPVDGFGERRFTPSASKQRIDYGGEYFPPGVEVDLDGQGAHYAIPLAIHLERDGVFNMGQTVLTPDSVPFILYSGWVLRIENTTGGTYRIGVVGDSALDSDPYDAEQSLFVDLEPRAVIYIPTPDVINDRQSAYLESFADADGLSVTWIQT